MAKQTNKVKKQNTKKEDNNSITCPYCFAKAEKVTCNNPDSLEMLGRLINPDEDNIYLCKNCMKKEVEKNKKASKGKVEFNRNSLCPCGTGLRRCCLYT